MGEINQIDMLKQYMTSNHESLKSAISELSASVSEVKEIVKVDHDKLIENFKDLQALRKDFETHKVEEKEHGKDTHNRINKREQEHDALRDRVREMKDNQKDVKWKTWVFIALASGLGGLTGGGSSEIINVLKKMIGG